MDNKDRWGSVAELGADSLEAFDAILGRIGPICGETSIRLSTLKM